MILKAANLSKSFYFPETVRLFSALSLSVAKGESIAITGRSGSGKTTLLHILGTLEQPDTGQITIAGTLLTKTNGAALRNKHIGFIFQSFNLLEDFTALENILMPARIGRKHPSKEYGMHLLEQVGLAERAHFSAKLLSGGEKQRVAIARALCNNPDLILADEPSGNLDQANADKIGSLLSDLVENQKKGLILVTHDPILASLCQKQFYLSNETLNNNKKN
jgi:ABC-type lipoprotein export system ATPase subunit